MEPDTLTDLLQEVLDARAERINTCMPAQVLSYDSATQRATVRPSLKRPVRTVDDEPTTQRLPDIPSVQVMFPRAGDFVLHMPIHAGDYVLLIFTQWNMGEWVRLGGVHVAPGDHRHHSLGSCVAIPGVFPSGAAVAGLSAVEAILGTVEGPNLRVSATKVSIGTSSSPHKRAARVGDPVRVTIPIGACVVSGAMGPSSNTTPLVFDGVIGPGGGSAAVDISD